jgi:transposase
MVSTMKMVDTKKGASRGDTAAGVRVNRTGRRTYTEAYKGDVVKQCSVPGVSVAAIALAHGINANLVRRWMVREQRRASVAVAPPERVMLPVTVEVPTQDSFAGTPGKRTHSEHAAIEIEFCGARIYLRDGVDAKMLRRVLDVLTQR